MRGLIVDFAGVLDGVESDRERWRRLFHAVRDNGAAVVILSNDPGGPAAAPIRAWQDKGFVDAVVLSGEAGVEKPEGAAFEAAAKAIGLGVADCVVVDDQIENVHAAVGAGLVGVFYQSFDRASVELVGLFGLTGEF